MIELVNGIATFGAPLTLVLDDFQSITDLECLDSIDYALEHLPPTTRLIVLTRSDPSLNLSRLRASGALAEVRASDLAFTRDEANELLVERGGLALEPDEVEVLRERTEGWPGALYLALLWLRSVENPHDAVREFGGDHRFVADYLNQEILSSLDEESRWFLLRTSVLGSSPPSSATACSDSSDAASTLETLEHSNLFVAQLGARRVVPCPPALRRVRRIPARSARPRRPDGDPSACCAVVSRTGLCPRRSSTPRPQHDHELHRQDRLRPPSAGDPERRRPHARPLGQDAAGRAARRASRAGDGRGDAPSASSARGRSSDVASSSSRERGRSGARRGLLRTSTPASGWFGRSPSTKASRRVSRGPPCGRDRGAGGRRRAGRLARRPGTGPLLRRRPRSRVGGGAAGARASGGRALGRPPTRSHGRRSHWSTSSGGVLDAARAHAEKAKALVGAIHSSRSWLGAVAYATSGSAMLPKGSSSRRSASWSTRSGSSETSWRRFTTPGCCCFWPVSVAPRSPQRGGRRAAARPPGARRAQGLRTLPQLAADVERELEEASSRAGRGEVLETPSEAELAVLRLLTSELSARDIGGELFLSANTVHTHTRAIYRSRRQLTR